MKRAIFLLTAFLSFIFLDFQFLFSQREIIQIRDKYGNLLDVQLNKITKTAHRVNNLKLNIDKYSLKFDQLNEKAIETFSSNIFDDYNDILGLKNIYLKVKRINSNGKYWFVSYSQYYKDIPVLFTEIGYTIFKTGDIITLGADAYPDINISTTPAVSIYQSILTAKENFKEKDAATKGNEELVIYPKEEDGKINYYLCWKLNLISQDSHKSFQYYINANNGKIVENINNSTEFNSGLSNNSLPNKDPHKPCMNANRRYSRYLFQKDDLISMDISGYVSGYYKEYCGGSSISANLHGNVIAVLDIYNQASYTNSLSNGNYSITVNSGKTL